MKTASTSQNSKACPFETWPQTCPTGAIQGVCLLPPSLYQYSCLRQALHQTSGHRLKKPRLLWQHERVVCHDFTAPPGGALTGWETRHRLLFCRPEKTALGTRHEVELLRITSVPASFSISWKTLCLTSRFSKTHSWKKKEKENNKLAQNCTSVAAVWIKKKKKC